MTADDGALTPRPEHRFSFGLWTVGNPGRDPFGEATRAPLDPVHSVNRLAELGAWGVSLHDNDLVPWGTPAAEAERIALPIAARRTPRSLEVNAPSLKAGWPNRFVVPMPTPSPVSSSAARKRETIRSSSAAEVPHGTRSLSCRLTPQAPSSASLCTESTGSSGARVGSPKGSRPGLPTVHSPKVKRGSVMRRPGAARRRGSGAGRPGRRSGPRRSSRWRCCP